MEAEGARGGVGRRRRHESEGERQNVEIAELVAKHGEARQAAHRRAEDQRPAVRLDQLRDAAYPEGKSENDERGRSQRNMHAV